MGGLSFEPYGFEFNEKLKALIRKRDNYICQLCGRHEGENTGKQKNHSVHHIDYDKYNNDPMNLISLCLENGCHSKTNFNREYWMGVFKKK